MRIKFKGRNFNAETLKKNLRQYVTASNNIGGGSLWYQIESSWIEDNKSEIEMYKACGIFAALSPQMSVERNRELFLQYLKYGKASHYGQLVRKCDEIMIADNEEEVLKILNGNKISSFYLNLLHPNRETRVTIDRHAIACLTQKIDNVKPLDDGQYSMTDRQYSMFEMIFKQVSDELGILAHELQAITWVSYRQTRGLN
mgnify:CR=1 FL=1